MYRFGLCCLGLCLIGVTAYPDSLFNQEAAKGGTLISEKKARFEKGDLITVLVRETIEASTMADTNTKKESDIEAKADESANQFLVANKPGGLNILNPEELPNWNIEVQNETKTTGKTRRNSTLITSVSCLVKEVHTNGNLLIEGEKQVTVNREDSTLHISGIIRSQDVSPGNTIPSSQMANAQVKLKGRGPLWNNQRRGLFTRFLDWFSPF